MIRCEVIEQFTFEEIYKLQNIKRKTGQSGNLLCVGDTFECDEKTAEYLAGKNKSKKVVIKVREIKPEGGEKKC